MFLECYQSMQLSGVVAFIFYLLFIRSQFLRVEQVTGHYNVFISAGDTNNTGSASCMCMVVWKLCSTVP